jgi:hypothetical protein
VFQHWDLNVFAPPNMISSLWLYLRALRM